MRDMKGNGVLTENDVVDAVAKELQTMGRRIVSRRLSTARGPELEAAKVDDTILVEANALAVD